MDIVAAVAHANEKSPEKAMIDGVRLQPSGKTAVKFPTDVKKLAVNNSAGTQCDTISSPVRESTHINSAKNCAATSNITNAMNLITSKRRPLVIFGSIELR